VKLIVVLLTRHNETKHPHNSRLETDGLSCLAFIIGDQSQLA
jgi:hypothetical protein